MKAYQMHNDKDKKSFVIQPLLISFFLPILILGSALALHGLYPFGDKQILAGFDAYSQYYPFLSEFWHRMRSGSSLLWSWTGGGGVDYLGLYAYYLASPLNYILILFPHEWLRELMAVLILIKIGLAGLFMAICLKGVFKNCDLSLSVFSVLYALCSFVLAYCWHIIWLDTIAMLPLVIYGVHSIIKQSKYKLFVSSLAVSVYCNFLFGLYTCIFVALYFFSQCIINNFNIKQFINKLKQIIVYSFIAIAMVAILLVPVFFNIMNTSNISNISYDNQTIGFTFYNSFVDVIGNLTVFNFPSEVVVNDLPNIFSGLISLFLCCIYFISSKINLREKITYGVMLLFIFISCNFQPLNYLWNGFYQTVGIRSRFSYILSFTLIILAYRAYLLILDDCCISYKNIFFIIVLLAGLLVITLFGPQERKYVLFSAVAILIYVLLYISYTKSKENMQNIIKLIAMIIILTETTVSANIAVGTFGLTERGGFPDRYNQMQKFIEERDPMSPDFYRTESYDQFTSNDPHLYNYNGISYYSSTANDALTNFYTGLGIPGRRGGKRYIYEQPSPLLDAFTDMKYLLVKDDRNDFIQAFWENVDVADGVYMYKNKYRLPLGFMVDTDISTLSFDMSDSSKFNPFMNQNELFKSSTGINENIFTFIDSYNEMHYMYHTVYNTFENSNEDYITYVKNNNNQDTVGYLSWDYLIPKNGNYFVYCTITNFSDMLNIFINSTPVYSQALSRLSVFPVGNLKEGDILTIHNPSTSLLGNVNLHVALINESVFEEGYKRLSSNTLNLKKFTDTDIVGNIAVQNEGILYTSIPYEKNKWKAYINGVENEIIPVCGAMTSLRLQPGSYEIEFKYRNPYFIIGLIISIISFLIFIMFIIMDKVNGKKASTITKE